MKNFNFKILIAIIFIVFNSYSQQKSKIKITGIVAEKLSNQKLEYATIRFFNSESTKAVFSSITNPKGEFEIDITPGIYNIKIEFISFEPLEIKNRNLLEKTNLGTIFLSEKTNQLNEVVVRAEKTAIDIKLDKKVFSIGNDLMVKGGTVSDVLNNVPSVSVDAEGNISLRGNEGVTILIDGKPSNAVNINEALRLFPADAIDKVEVITNPSSRYDAEGGAGILNIILKKGKNRGFNGTLIAAVGYPENQSISGTINYKSKNYNLFTTQGFSDRNTPGNLVFKNSYLAPKPNTPNLIIEKRKFNNNNQNYNGNLGIELFLNPTTTWTNSLSYRKSAENITDKINFDNQFAVVSQNNIATRTRNEIADEDGFEFKSFLQKKFKKEGHKLDVDIQIAETTDNSNDNIIDSETGNDFVKNNQTQNRKLFQTDYVLPTKAGSQFEAGYRGSFFNQTSDLSVFNNNIINNFFTNKIEYIENVNAFYTQYGIKANKFSYLFGLRWEDTNVEVNQLTTKNFVPKKYNNFFPSAFITYEFSKETSISLNYSRRITRPRGRFIIPFTNYSSNFNIYVGNQNLNPSMTNAFDFGFLRKFPKVLLSTSIYTNRTTDSFLFIRKKTGIILNNTELLLITPVNLDTEHRTGFELNLNFSPYKWMKLNSNFNYFYIETKGNHTFTDFSNKVVTQNLNQKTTTWSAKLNSKITLPKKIDWQINMNYNGDQKTAQGKSIGIFSMNTGFSKDILKDKATLAFNVSDVLNSRKIKNITNIPNFVSSDFEWQRTERQFTLSFTYRFNKQKNEREKQPKRDFEEGGDM